VVKKGAVLERKLADARESFVLLFRRAVRGEGLCRAAFDLDATCFIVCRLVVSRQ